MKARPTMSDIAKIVGVSKASVSMALNGRRQVSKALLEKVRAAATSIGYRRDPALTAIAASRWKNNSARPGSVIAYVVMARPGTVITGKSQEFFYAEERADSLGYRLEAFEISQHQTARQLSKVLWNRGINGVLFPQIYSQQVIDEFEWEKFATATIHDGYFQPPVDHYTPSYTHAIIQCWQQSIARSYRRPGVVLFKEIRAHTINFLIPASLLQLQQEHAAKCAALPVLYFDDADPSSLAHWIKKYSPDVIIGLNDFYLYELLKLGLSIPGDVSYCSILKDPNSETSGVLMDNKGMFSQAVDRVDSLIRTGDYGLTDHYIVHRFVGRWSEGKTLPVRDEIAKPRNHLTTFREKTKRVQNCSA